MSISDAETSTAEHGSASLVCLPWVKRLVSVDTTSRVPNLGLIEMVHERAAITQLVRALTADQDKRKVAYGTEVGFFEGAGIPSVVCGPGNIEQAHKQNEYVDLVQLAVREQFLRKLIRQSSRKLRTRSFSLNAVENDADAIFPFTELSDVKTAVEQIVVGIVNFEAEPRDWVSRTAACTAPSTGAYAGSRGNPVHRWPLGPSTSAGRGPDDACTVTYRMTSDGETRVAPSAGASEAICPISIRTAAPTSTLPTAILASSNSFIK